LGLKSPLTLFFLPRLILVVGLLSCLLWRLTLRLIAPANPPRHFGVRFEILKPSGGVVIEMQEVRTVASSAPLAVDMEPMQGAVCLDFAGWGYSMLSHGALERFNDIRSGCGYKITAVHGRITSEFDPRRCFRGMSRM
jgi:hypothetical protein